MSIHTRSLPIELQRRIVRYDELRPCKTSFIDTRNPGSEEKESFQVIGGGVVENPSKYIHINIPHGFNMGGARMPPGVVNGQHSHDTAEVFLVHRGKFKMTFGPNREDGDIELELGDVVSIPTQAFRGFMNSGNDIGHLVSIIGGEDPGRVVWAPYIFEEAKKHGLVLLENGNLIDTLNGERIPEGVKPVKPTDEADMKHFQRLTPETMRGWYVRNDELRPAPGSPLAREGVQECPVIGVANPAENMPEAPIGARHGFHARRVRMVPGSSIPAHTRSEVEVLFVHSGSARITIDGYTVDLGKGDYFTLPIGSWRAWSNVGDAQSEIHVVRGGDHPAAPTWQA